MKFFFVAVQLALALHRVFILIKAALHAIRGE